MKRKIIILSICLTTIYPFVPKAQVTSNSSISIGYTSFDLAIKDSIQLGLKPKQIIALEQGLASLTDSVKKVMANPSIINFNRPAFERQCVTSILTNKQYLLFLNLNADRWAISKAQNLWASTISKGEDDMYLKDTVIKEATSFLSKKKFILDFYYHDKSICDSLIELLYSKLSDNAKALIIGKASFGISSNQMIKSLLSNRKILKLNINQIQGVLNLGRFHKHLLVDGNNDSWLATNNDSANFLISNELQKFLSHNQIVQAIIANQYNNAKEEAQNKWLNASKNGITGNYKKDTIICQLTSYFSKKFCFKTLYANNSSQLLAALDSLTKQTPDSIMALVRGDKWYGAYKAGWVGFALTQADKLDLNNKQKSILLASARQMNALKSSDTSTSFHMKLLDFQSTINTLTNAQFSQLLNIKNKQKALEMAQNCWKVAVIAKANYNFDETNGINALSTYFLNRYFLKDWHFQDTVKQRISLDSLDGQTPDSLKVLITGNKWYGADMKGAIGLVLNNSDSFDLNNEQKSFLLNAARKLNVYKHTQDTVTKFDANTFETSNLHSILTSKQFTIYLDLKYRPFTTSKAQQYWQSAVDSKATGNYIKSDGINALVTYFINKASLKDWYYQDTVKQRVSLDSLNAARPDSLMALFTLNKWYGADMYGLLGFALSNADTIHLTKIQAFQIYASGINERKLIIAAESRPDSLKFDRAVYEATQMPKLLSDSQYTQLLKLRFQSSSYKTAQSSWQQLTTLGLTTKLNKDSTIGAITTYYIKRSSINARYANDTETKAFLLRKLDFTMPLSLVQLKYAQRGGTGKPSSGVYVW